MTSNYKRTADWLKACGKEPEPNNLSVQIGCKIEEDCEFLKTLRTESDGYAKLVNGQPVLLEGGKIGKPEGWKPPDLRGCV